MAELFFYCVLFVGSHFLLATGPFRNTLVSIVGEKLFLLVYSLLSFIFIYLFVSSYANLEDTSYMYFPSLMTHILPILFVPLSLYLIIGGLSTPNPSMAGNQKILANENLANGVMKITRHPVQWGIFFWSVSHLLATGTLEGLIFFGGFAVLSGLGSVVIDKKMHHRHGELWDRFGTVSSNIPFLGILSGKVTFSFKDLSYGVILLSIILTLILWWGHGYFEIGALLVNPFSG